MNQKQLGLTPPPLFQTHLGAPAFERSICVFLDVLGFSETQRRSFEQGRGLEEFQRLYLCLREQFELLGGGGVSLPWKLKVFTDNIVLGRPLREDHHEIGIGEVAIWISSYQLALARAGYFVRGGIALDELFIDELVVYGPALLEAYELEHTTARDPRIVISRTVRTLILEHFGYYAEPQFAPQNQEFLLDSDGQIFLNYLQRCFVSVHDGMGADCETLYLHKANIEKGLSASENAPRIWSKYSWLATYHNFVINKWRDTAGLDDSMLVNPCLHRTGPVHICPFLVPPQTMPPAS